MRKPIIETLAMLAPNLARVLAEAAIGDREQIEVILQDALNSYFGSTSQTIEALEGVSDAMKDAAKELE